MHRLHSKLSTHTIVVSVRVPECVIRMLGRLLPFLRIIITNTSSYQQVLRDRRTGFFIPGQSMLKNLEGQNDYDNQTKKVDQASIFFKSQYGRGIAL